MADERKQQALAQEILADAERQADRHRQRAERSAARIIKSATTRMKDLETKVTEEARARLERETTRILADIPHQEQVRKLRVKNDVIAGLSAETLDAFQAGQLGDALPVLVRLSSDAIAHLDGDRFVLEVTREDAEKWAEPLAQETTQKVQAGQARAVTVEVVVSSDGRTDGGVVVRSADPTGAGQIVDNSFTTRMRRGQQRLRARIADLIFGGSEE